MNKELYFRLMAQKMQEMMELAKKYCPDDEYFAACMYKGHFSIHNDPESENHYSFWFDEGADVLNDEIKHDRFHSYIL